MSTKDAVNSVVAKVSGYYLTKGKPGEAEAEIRRQREKIVAQRAKIQKLTDQIAGKKSPAAQRQRNVAFPNDFDENTREIIRAVREYTMTGVDKLHALISATRYVARHNIPGDIVECGVWRGGSMQAAALTLIECGDTSRDLYLFDTFEGMPPPSIHDVRHDGKPAADLLAAQDKDSTVWAVATLDDVQKGFAQVPYPADKVHFIKGKVEDTVPAEVPETISILRLDTDWYESTAHELLHMWDRLSSGGVLLIDDYGHWKGSRQATDEFLDRTGARLLLVRMNSGRVAVKP
jgi:O-methyltransferase